MGGSERVQKQASKGRLNARERIAALCDGGSFREIGLLAGGNHPAGHAPVPADGLVAGTARVDGESVVVMAEDFTVQGGSIGHAHAAKRLRLAMLAKEQELPVILMLDGAGERASNALERYPYAPNDLQVFADLKGQVPVVALVLGASAGHGALTGMLADFIVMTENATLFTAGPPLVKAALGVDATPEQLGGARMHATQSGVIHNLVATEEEAFAQARCFLSLLPRHAGAPLPASDEGDTVTRTLADMLEVVPANLNQPYDMRDVIRRLVDGNSFLELQALYGASMITAMARIGGVPVLLVANQPKVQAGAITAQAASKAAHFIRVANAFALPVVFLADNPGVMPGTDSERAGVLKAAAEMYAAQHAITGSKVHVTLRKAFGFGSSVMGMNPMDHQAVTLAFPGVSLGGMPAISGADAAKSSEADKAQLQQAQGAAWVPADNMAYDRVIDPRELRNEVIAALQLSR
ncbi:MAG: carboxyl transferase [Gammaproteobacteria bacterium]|nr:MAG: carboxyl transferase [Gammaproteobacteria bacterium]